MNIGSINNFTFLNFLFDITTQAKKASNKLRDYYLELVIQALISTVTLRNLLLTF